MNHIYKSIFNKALGVFTAVPEFASAHGKGSERTVVGRVAKGAAGFAASALAISIGLALTSTSAVAYPGIYINDRQAGNCLAINDTAVANLGVGTILDVNSTPGSVELKVPGTYAPQTGITPSYYNAAGSARPCVAVGGSTVDNRDTQTNRTLFYGGAGATTEAAEVNDRDNGAKNLTLGGRLDVNSGIIGVGDRGVNGAGATNSIRMGTGTTLDEANKKINSIAIGVNTQATSHYATAIGEEALANGSDGALAIGRKATANATSGPMAIGYDAVTTGKSGIAQGYHAHTNAQSGLAIGDNAKASGIGQVAIGYASNAQKPDIDKTNTAAPNKADYSVTVGHYAGADYTGTNNIRSTLVGDSAGRYGEEGNQNTAVGSLAGMYVKGSNNVALGIGTGSGSAAEKLEVNSTVAIGNNAKALTDDSISIGRDSKAGKVDKFDGKKSIAIGYASEAMGSNAIALGSNAATNNGHDSIAMGTYAKTNGEKTISIGAYNTAEGAQSIVIAGNYDASTGSNRSTTTAAARRAIVVGPESHATAEDAVAIGNKNTVASARTYAMGNNINVAAGADDSLAFGTKASVGGANAIALGNTAKATKENTIAQGTESVVYGKNSVSIGYKAVSGIETPTPTQTNAFSVSIGNETEAIDASTIAIGDKAKAKGGVDALAVGTQANAMTYKALAIGAYSQATGRQSTVIGNDIQGQPSIASGTRSQILGVQSNVSGDNSVSIGDTNTIAGARTYAMGNNINVAAGVDDALAFGTKAAVGGTNAIALGNTASAAINNAIAVGQASSSTGNSAIAIGTKASAQGDSAVAHGVESAAIAQSSTAIGFRAKAQGYEQISIGSNAGNSSPANAENYGAVFIGRHAGSGNNSATGNTDGVSIGSNAGQNAVSGIKNVAIGPTTGQNVEGNQNLALSTNAGNSVKGDNNLAMMVGAGNNIEGGNNIAIGTNANSGTPTAKRVVTNSIAMGANTQATSNNTIAIGPQARALAADAVALGLGSLSNHANSVALGAGSVTSAAHTGDYTLNTSYTAAGLPVAANGTVSVGSAGKERQIQNVAAGVISATSTDAINGSQLYATNNYLSNLAGGVKNVLGGDAAVDNAGNLTMSDVGGTGKGNVHEAIAAVKGVADTAVQEVESENPTALSVKKDGTKVTLTPNFITGDLVNADGTVNAPATADEGKLVSAKTVADALKANHFVVDTKGNTETGSEADAKVGSGNKVTFEAGNNLVAKQANTANGGATVKFSLKDDISLNSVTAGTGANQVVLGNDGVKVGGNTYINNDGLNANSKVISNVADGVNPNDAVNKSQLDAVKGVADSAVKSVDTVASEENLVVDNNDPQNPKLRLKKAVNLTSIKLDGATPGNTTYVSGYGLTIEDGPSVKKAGINAGDKKITGVADGNVAAGSTDAVNGGQLAAVKAKADSAVQDVKSGDENALTAVKDPSTNIVTVTPKLSGDLVDANGNITAPTTPADKGKLVTAGTVAEALANTHFVVDTKATDGELDAASQADQKIKASNKVTLQAGKNLKAKQTNGANGAEVEFSLKDSISLKEVKVGEGSANEVVLNNNGVNVAGNTYINKDGLNANGNKVANVKAGDVSATSTDAVNGAQLHNVATSVANVLGGNAAVDGNGNVTSSDIGGTGANTVHDAIKAVNATAAKHTTVVEGKNVKVTKGKNAAGGDEYTVATKDDLDVTSVTAGNTTVNTNGLTITGGPSVTRGGIDAGDRVISGVKAGDVSANSKEAVNGSQLYATNTKLDGVKAKADTAVQDVKSGDENALTAVKDPNTNIVTVTPKLSGDLVDADGNITAPATPADKGKLVTAGTVADALANTHFVVDTKATDGELDAASQADQKIKAGNKVTLQAGKNLKAKQTNGANGAQVEFSLKDSISLTEVTAGTGDNQVVLGNNGVQVGGNTYINKDGLNANSKVISNVADGVNPNDAVNKGQLDAVKGVADSAVKSVDVANGEQNLVVDNTDPKNPKLSLKKDLTVDSVKAGDSTLNTDGLTITGGPSVKKDGIDAGDKKITNVAAGDVSATSKDAVNGGQLYNVANNVKDLIGPDAAIDPATGKVTVADPAQGIAGTGKGTIGEAIKSVKDKADTAVQDIKSGDEKALSVTKAGNTYTITPNLSGDLVDADGNITAPTTAADKGKLVTAGTVAQALANTHFVVDTQAATDGELDTDSKHDQKIKAGNKVTLQAGKNLKAKQTNGTDGAQVEFSLKDSISLTQVTAGEGDNQVVLGNDGVKVGGNTYINNAGLNANGNKITNVADGVDPTDAVNKGQLDAVKTVADSAVKSVDVANGEQNLVVDNSDPKNPKLSLKKDLTVDSVKAGDSTLNTDGLTITGGPSVKKDGINAGDKTITNVADGVNAKDAVNKGQLDAVDTKVSNVAQNVVNVLGGDAKAEGNGDITMSNIGGTGKNTVHDAIAAVNKSATAAKTKVVNGKNITVDPVVNPDGSTTYTISTAENLDVTSVTAGDSTLNNDGLTITGGPSVKKDGIDAADKKITNVAPGAVTSTSKDAVNGSQLYSVAGNVKDLIGPDVTIDSATGNITVADPAKGIGGTGKGTIGDAIAAVNKSAVAANTKVKAGSNITVNEVIDEKDGSKTYTVSTAKDLNVDSVKAGNTTINNNGIEIVNGPSMTKDGINAAGKAISNVANGNVAKGSKDAVNGGQLHETAQSVADVIGGGATVKDGKVVAGQNGIGNTGQNTVHGAIAAINQNTANNFNQIRGDLRKMDRDLRGGIAGALATAGLPQAFRPGKSMVAAAASTYRGQSGLAIGVSRISDNGKVILKVTGNTNSRGDFGGTIGAGYQW